VDNVGPGRRLASSPTTAAKLGFIMQSALYVFDKPPKFNHYVVIILYFCYSYSTPPGSLINSETCFPAMPKTILITGGSTGIGAAPPI